MSKVYETRIVPPREQKVCIRRKCDLCKLESNGDDWDGGYYEINETHIFVKITQKDGTNYPEGGSGTEYEIDLCPGCFKDRFVPWLKSEGADIEDKEWDW